MAGQIKRPWNVVFGASLCYILLVGVVRTFGIFYSDIVERFQSTRAEAAVIMSIQNGVRSLLAPAAHVMKGYLGVQLSVILGALLFSIGFMTSVIYPSIYTLYITIGVISGIGASAAMVIPFMAVNEHFLGDAHHSMAMSIATTGVGIGTIIFAPISEWLLSTYGFNGAMLMIGALMLNVCVGGALLRGNKATAEEEEAPLLQDTSNSIVYTIVEEEVKEHTATDEDTLLRKHTEADSNGKNIKGHLEENRSMLPKSHTKHEAALESPHLMHLSLQANGCHTDMNKTVAGVNTQQRTKLEANVKNKHINTLDDDSGSSRTQHHLYVHLLEKWLDVKALCTVSLFLFMINMVLMSTVIYSSLLFIDKLGEELAIPSDGTAWVLMLMGLMDIVGRFVFGFLFDLTYLRDKKHFCLAWLGILLGVATFGMGIAVNYEQLLVYSALYGILEGGYGAQAMTSICELVPLGTINAAISITIALQGVGQFIGPVLQGLVSDYFNTSRAAYTISGLVFAFTSVLCVLNWLIQKYIPTAQCSPHTYTQLTS